MHSIPESDKYVTVGYRVTVPCRARHMLAHRFIGLYFTAKNYNILRKRNMQSKYAEKLRRCFHSLQQDGRLSFIRNHLECDSNPTTREFKCLKTKSVNKIMSNLYAFRKPNSLSHSHVVSCFCLH